MFFFAQQSVFAIISTTPIFTVPERRQCMKVVPTLRNTTMSESNDTSKMLSERFMGAKLIYFCLTTLY